MTALLFLGGIGTPEILVILAVGLLIFGGRLPEVARSLGKSFIEFRRGLRGLSDEIERDPDPYPPPSTSPRIPPPNRQPPGPAGSLPAGDEAARPLPGPTDPARPGNTPDEPPAELDRSVDSGPKDRTGPASKRPGDPLAPDPLRMNGPSPSIDEAAAGDDECPAGAGNSADLDAGDDTLPGQAESPKRNQAPDEPGGSAT